MDSAADDHGSDDKTTGLVDPDPWRRLLHRWLVEYNPLYLLSATLVLGGVTVVSRGLAQEGSLYGQLGVAAIAEVYAWSLVGGAALLVRIGLRRPAVLLALLTALYQGDLTLHTETCAFLGGVGLPASVAWVLIFVAKLYGLAWALRLRLSRSAVGVATLGAVGLAAMPHLGYHVGAQVTNQIVGLWVFALGAAALYTVREVRSLDPLESWGRTVLRRTTRATWVMWAILLLLHFWFWHREFRLDMSAVVLAVLMLSTRWLRGELGVWTVVAATLAFTALCLPAFLSTACLMAAATLALRAYRSPRVVVHTAGNVSPSGPYRTPGVSDQAPVEQTFRLTFERAAPAAWARLIAGSMLGLYLFFATLGWSGGSWPEMTVVLEGMLALAAVVAHRFHRRPVVFVPMAAVYGAWTLRALPVPQTLLQWGGVTVASGFALLALSLAFAWSFRHDAARLGRAGASPSGQPR
jgi:hypothetical protein